jgi:hypothetical protein
MLSVERHFTIIHLGLYDSNKIAWNSKYPIIGPVTEFVEMCINFPWKEFEGYLEIQISISFIIKLLEK